MRAESKKKTISPWRQHWIHIEIEHEARQWGFTTEDLFVMVQPTPPFMRHNYQHHARKNHSYAWVFKKAGQL